MKIKKKTGLKRLQCTGCDIVFCSRDCCDIAGELYHNVECFCFNAKEIDDNKEASHLPKKVTPLLSFWKYIPTTDRLAFRLTLLAKTRDLELSEKG
eukprot:Pgem_evm1s17382